MGDWIKVSEHLPEGEMHEVLVHTKMGGFYIGEWSGKDWYDSTGAFLSGVTHWMPLPEEPPNG